MFIIIIFSVIIRLFCGIAMNIHGLWLIVRRERGICLYFLFESRKEATEDCDLRDWHACSLKSRLNGPQNKKNISP